MSWPFHYNAFFSLVQGLRGGTNNHWSGHCPSHDDRHSSLSINVADDGLLLVQCHAPHACNFESIRKAMRLEPKDFFPPRSKSMAGSSFVKSYDYRDETGKLLYSACRFDPKSFCQRRPNPAFNANIARGDDNKEFIYNLDGVRLVLYKLPELKRLLAENPKRWTFIVEGERDVDLAMINGLCATCNPMGALKWGLSNYADSLTNCNVVIIPDEDPVDAKLNFAPGLKHALEVAESLRGKAFSIRILRLPVSRPKGDFSQWWIDRENEGWSLDQKKSALGRLIQACPEWICDLPPDPVGGWQEVEAKKKADTPLAPGEVAPGQERPPLPPRPADEPQRELPVDQRGDAWEGEPAEALPAPSTLAEVQPGKLPAGSLKWDGSVSESIHAVLDELTAKRLAFGCVRSDAEWIGLVAIELVRWHTATGLRDRKLLRKAAADVAATLMMALDDLHE